MKRYRGIGLCALVVSGAILGQTQTANWTTADDHQDMMRQLGIKALRPGPSGNEKAPNHANYDDSTANPFPNYPDALVLKNGQKVTTPGIWWDKRRPEIIEDFEREVLGRVPKNAPKITWSVTNTVDMKVGGRPVVVQQLTGHADNSAYPAITVDIQGVLVRPAEVKHPVPVMIMFGRAVLPGTPPPPGFPPMPPSNDPPAPEQLIADGWGYLSLAPNSVQADNGAGLTKGVIGLANHGQPRKPEDWGALRAWAWGASRALDYLETVPEVDARRVGIEGVSRYGKAALVTMAFDRRFAVVLIGSSGEGGTKPHRRSFGEAVENLTGSGEYHWMAGNFLKYGASEASSGSKNAGDIPVDSNELIALCAPRPTFVSYGIPEKGDAKWLDQQGSYMASLAAGAVFRLLGAQDLGVKEDYRTAQMPPVLTPLLDGQLAWRQHDGGHTDGPNWRWFLPWADRELGHLPMADYPAPRLDANSWTAHLQLVEKVKKGRIDVYFEGDSITRRWGASDYPQFLANWKQNFQGWNAADFGWGADLTQNILWRVQNGEMEGVKPKVMVLLAGTNNIGRTYPDQSDSDKVDSVVRGVEAIVAAMREKAPEATLILMSIFPRSDNIALLPVIERANARLAKLADSGKVRVLNINDRLNKGTMVDGLHLSTKGYQIWADALKPLLTEVLGPPSNEDLAPPPTGDPRAAR